MLNRIKSSGAFKNLQIFYLVVGIFVFALLFVPQFATLYNLKNLCLQVSSMLIVTLGVTFPVLNGGLDFSSVSVLSLSSVVGAYIMALSPIKGTPLSIVVAIVVMILIGGIVGIINGFSIVKLKMPSFIVTFSTQLIVSGIAVYFTSCVTITASIGGLPQGFNVIGGSGNFFFLPVAIALVFYLFTDWLCTKTIFGRNVLIVGANPQTAHVSGIKVKKTIFLLFIISGLYSGACSVILTARNMAGISGLGDKMFIDVMSAIIIGGTSVFGGKGGARNTLCGVIFVTIIGQIMNLYGLDWYVSTFIKGLIVLIAALIDIFTTQLEIARSSRINKTNTVQETEPVQEGC